MRYLLCLCLVFSAFTQVAFSQDSNVLQGVIELEQSEKKKDPFLESQDDSITYFTELPAKLKALKNSGTKLEDLSDGVLTHMTYTYLYCTVRRGVCKEVIDAIIEIDIANSALAGEVSCPNMKRFWKIWISNDMQKRQNFSVRTGFIGKVTEFTRSELPRYLKCKGTIQEILKKAGENIFFERYAEDSGVVKVPAKVAKMLQAIKKKVPNLIKASQ